MHKVIMKYENIEKYFSLKRYKKESKFILIPETKEIFPYMKKIISYENDYTKYTDVIYRKFDNFEDYHQQNKNFEKDFLCYFNNDEILIFEFETEEEAFYFKLKYC